MTSRKKDDLLSGRLLYCLFFDFQFILDDVRGVLEPISDDFNCNEFVDFMEFSKLAAERSIKAVMEFLTL